MPSAGAIKGTAGPVLRHHSLTAMIDHTGRPYVLKEQMPVFLAEGPTFHSNRLSHCLWQLPQTVYKLKCIKPQSIVYITLCSLEINY